MLKVNPIYLKSVCVGCVILSCTAFAVPPEPEFYWDGDFNIAQKGDATLSLNGNTLEDGGARVCIGPASANGGKGVFIDWSSKPKGGVSILVKYAGYAPPASNWAALGLFRGVLGGKDQADHPGLAINSSGGTKGIWMEGVWSGSGQQTGTFAAGDGSGCYLFRNCPGTTAVTVYQKQAGEWSTVYSCTSLKATKESVGTAENGILGYAVGGADRSSYSGVNPLTGMQILGVAVFNGELSKESAAEYVFPSDQGVGTVTLDEGTDYAWSTLEWSGITPTASADSMVIRVNGDAVLDMDVSNAVVLNCKVEGSGSLTLTSTGMLSAVKFVTSVPLNLQTETGVLTWPGGLNTDCTPAFGNGEVKTVGALLSSGISGPGTLKVTEGTVLLNGNEDFTGPVAVEGNGTVVTTNGVIGTAGFRGNGRVCFQTVLPDATMLSFFKATDWKGRAQLDRISGNCADINPDLYSNPSSKTVFAGVKGWVPGDATFANELELSKFAWDGTQVLALELSDGYGWKTTVFSKLSGRGWLKDTHDSANTAQVLRFVDVSDFHGTLFMRVKRAVFGATAAPKENGGTIYVPAGIHLDAYGPPDADDCGIICARNGVFIDGELTVAAPAFFVMDGVQTPVTVSASGLLRFAMNATFNKPTYNDRDANYSIIGGTGTLEFTDYGTGSYRALPASESRWWQAGLKVVNNQGTGAAGGILLTHRGTAAEPAVRTIDTFSGTGGLRSDGNMDKTDSWKNVPEENRSLRVVQGYDTTWSGVIGGGYDNIAEFRVAAAESAPGATLTMTGVNTTWRDTLVVEYSGSVRLDGTWNGDISVEGTFGGSGTNTNGRVTFAAGAVFDARRGLFVADEIGSWSPNAKVLISERRPDLRTPIMSFSTLAEGVRGSVVTVQYDDGTIENLSLAVRGKTLFVAPQGTCVILK